MTDRQTDGQNYDSQDRPRICSRGKIRVLNHLIGLSPSLFDAPGTEALALRINYLHLPKTGADHLAIYATETYAKYW